jgi:hypothetical protein
VRTAKHILLFVLVAAAFGLGVFGVMVYRAVSSESAEPSLALRRFTDARAALRPGPPLLELDQSGHVRRRAEPRTGPPGPIHRLSVLAYHAGVGRLVSADVPFWFLRIKGPAAQFALRETGFDLERLGITPADLERHGPSLVIDWSRANGDRLLVWTE